VVDLSPKGAKPEWYRWLAPAVVVMCVVLFSDRVVFVLNVGVCYLIIQSSLYSSQYIDENGTGGSLSPTCVRAHLQTRERQLTRTYKPPERLFLNGTGGFPPHSCFHPVSDSVVEDGLTKQRATGRPPDVR